MKPVIYLPDALAEMIEAARFYDNQVQGLGSSFLDTIQRGIDNIQQHPKRWAPW